MDSGPLVQANTPILREMQPLGADPGRAAGTRVYPELLSQESALGEYFRILLKRKWTVVACLVTIFSVVAIASLKMTPVYEARGTIAINKADSGLVNFNNSPTFNVDYYDPTELETEVRILQSDLLALQVIKELALDRRPEFGGKTPALPSTLDLAPDALQADTGRTSSLLSSFRGNLAVALVPNSHIIEVHYRSPNKELAATVVNTVMSTYAENNFKSRFDSTMQASDWLSKQLVDLQMKVETSQEKLVKYQKEHEILGIDEKQNITTAKLDELNRELTTAESVRMEKESIYHLVQNGDSDSIAAAANVDGAARGSSANSALLEKLREQQADLKIQVAQLSTQFGPSYPKLAQLNSQLKEVDAEIQSEIRKVAARLRGDYLAAVQRESMLRTALEQQKQEANKPKERAMKDTRLNGAVAP